MAQLTASSRRVVASRLDSAAKAVGLRDALEIDWRGLDRPLLLIVKERLKHLSPSSLNAIYSALKGIALVAYENQVIGQDQYLRVKNTKSIKGDRVRKYKMLENNTLKKLLGACDSVRDKALLSVLIFCGLRRAEVVEIKWQDIDWEQSSILIHGKGNKERYVYFNNDVEQLLKELRKESTNQYCFISKQYKDKLTTQAVYTILQSIQKKAGVDKFSPHNFRRYFISKLLEQGNDLSIVSSMVGHSKLETTRIYDVRGEEQKRKVGMGIMI